MVDCCITLLWSAAVVSNGRKSLRQSANFSVVVDLLLGVVATAGARAAVVGTLRAESGSVTTAAGRVIVVVTGARASSSTGAVLQRGRGAAVWPLFVFLRRFLHSPSTVGKPRGHLRIAQGEKEVYCNTVK
jgi:hypothetical protein